MKLRAHPFKTVELDRRAPDRCRATPGTGTAALKLVTVGAALCAGVLSGASFAASTPIYKCLDKNQGLVYTDEPCSFGERMDIRAGDADAAAIARLDRERDALNQSAAQRIADERRAADAERLERLRSRSDGYTSVNEPVAYEDDDAGYSLAYGYPYTRPARPHRPRPPPLVRERSVPATPAPRR